MPVRRLMLAALVSCVTGATSTGFPLGTRPAGAQQLWTEASTLGYSALGFGAAAALILGGNCGTCTVGAGLGIVAGGLGFGAGHLIGSSAEASARRGQRPSVGQLWGVRIGSVLAGTSLGALVAGVRINRKQVKEPEKDERDLLILSLLGAAVGVWVELGQEEWMRGAAPANLTPTVRRAADGRTELGVTVRTRW